MSFAYIQGQEAEALAYFERLLNQPLPPSDRKQLEALVHQLRDQVQKKDTQSKLEPALQNSQVGLNLQKA